MKYLKESEEIYNTIMNLIESDKNPERTKTLVKLLSFLLSVDTNENLGEIIRDLYLKLEDK